MRFETFSGCRMESSVQHSSDADRTGRETEAERRLARNIASSLGADPSWSKDSSNAATVVNAR